MGLGMSCSMRQSVQQEMSLEQRHALLQEQKCSLRLALIADLSGTNYTPFAKCPQCGCGMDPWQIIRGFNDNPTDYTTECPGCHHRFAPQLRSIHASGETVLPFYCASQTLAQMGGLENLSPQELQKAHPAVYHSAIVHFGLIKNAFAKLNVTYAFDEVADRKKVAANYLGRLPDAMIAQLTGLKTNTVRRMRKQAGIEAWSQRAALEEIEDNY